MQITKTVSIMAVVCAAMMVLGQNAYATSDTFKVQVILNRVDSQTGELEVEVTGADGTSTSKIVNPFKEGNAGNVNIGTFTLDSDTTPVGEHYEVCVYSTVDYDVYNCANFVNHKQTTTEKIAIGTPTGISNPIGNKVYHPEATYYDDNGNVIPVNNFEQGDDSTSTVKDQGSGVNVNFGDDSDNNNVNIDQRSTFADTLNYLIPKAGSAIKSTARELLN